MFKNKYYSKSFFFSVCFILSSAFFFLSASTVKLSTEQEFEFYRDDKTTEIKEGEFEDKKITYKNKNGNTNKFTNKEALKFFLIEKIYNTDDFNQEWKEVVKHHKTRQNNTFKKHALINLSKRKIKLTNNDDNDIVEWWWWSSNEEQKKIVETYDKNDCSFRLSLIVKISEDSIEDLMNLEWKDGLVKGNYSDLNINIDENYRFNKRQ